VDALEYYVGLDLGQSSDFSALCVLEAGQERPEHAGQVMAAYRVRSLKRWHLGTPYPEIVADVVKFLDKPPLKGCTLSVDQTGVGAPVVDMLKAADPGCDRLVPITITAGRKVSFLDGGYHVAKIQLVSTVQVLLQSRRLKFAEGLELTPLLVKELENYRVTVTAAANETFDPRSGEHDDLVLSLALACFQAEHAPSGPVGLPMVLAPLVPW
jgi:hypothetical protein